MTRTMTFTNEEVWTDPVLIVRDNWEGRGYRLYWTPSIDSDMCVGTEGECSRIIYRTIAEAIADAKVRFPGVRVSRSQR